MQSEPGLQTHPEAIDSFTVKENPLSTALIMIFSVIPGKTKSDNFETDSNSIFQFSAFLFSCFP